MYVELMFMFPDIGADVLDLAETMVASDGLKYEPVSIVWAEKKLIYTSLYVVSW